MNSARATEPFSLLTAILVAGSAIIALVPTSFSSRSQDVLQNLAEGSMLRQAQLALLFMLAGILLYRHWSATVERLRHLNPFLVLLVAYCGLSMLWSPFPVVTLKRAITFAGLIMIGLALSPPSSTFRHVMSSLRWSLTLICLISALTALAAPAIGTDPLHNGAWRGITWHKNMLGATAAYAAILWHREALQGPGRRLTSLAALLFCLVTLLMAKSSTAMLLGALGLAWYTFFHRPWLRGRHLGLGALLALAVASLLALHFFYVNTGRFLGWNDISAPIAALFGKSSDLTGRTDIWRLVMLAVQQHPILGIGYGAFWLGLGGPSQYVADFLGWAPTQAHNGYLDVLNELGVVGSCLMLCTLLWYIMTLVRLALYQRDAAACYTTFLLILLVSNLSETSLLFSTSFQNILFVYMCTMASSQLWAVRQQAFDAPPHAVSR